MSRGTTTWLLYAVFACMAFLLNGLGAVLAPLQKELGVNRGDVAFYPGLFAAGLVIVGVSGGPLVQRIGRPTALRVALGMLGLGAVLFAVPGRGPTLLGDLLIGLGGALLIQLVPALLSALHPGMAAAAVGEVNGLASAVSVLAPLSVAAAIGSGAGWRVGYLAPALIVLALLAWPLSRASLPVAPRPVAGRRLEDAPVLGRWVDLVLAVSVEFCMVFWAASALGDWHGASAAQAPALASLFLVGMAACRALAAPITRRLPDGQLLITLCALVAAVGFALFWVGPNLAAAAVGLAVTGLGVALLYPTTISRLIAAWPQAPDQASARAALGSGLAIGGAPFALGRLSDAVGLRAAYLLVPVLLGLLVARGALGAPRLRPVEALGELDDAQPEPPRAE
jgi:fucose permease